MRRATMETQRPQVRRMQQERRDDAGAAGLDAREDGTPVGDEELGAKVKGEEKAVGN